MRCTKLPDDGEKLSMIKKPSPRYSNAPNELLTTLPSDGDAPELVFSPRVSKTSAVGGLA